MAIETTGKIFKIFETKQVSATFSKREFVLEIEDGKYPQHVLFQFTGDKCGTLDDSDEGDVVSVQFNLRGREWTSPKGEVCYFNSLDAWRLVTTNKSTGGAVASPVGDAGPNLDADIPF